MFYFFSDVDTLMKKEFTPSPFINSLVKVITPIRKEMAKISNSLGGSFPPDCQQFSVLIQLQIMCSLLIDCCDPRTKGFNYR